MSFNDATGLIGPILGLAVAGYAVKTIGGMFHAKCDHCGHTTKGRSHAELLSRTRQHDKSHRKVSNMWY